MQTLLGFIGVIILLWLVWYIGGGPQRYQMEGGGKFLNPPAPLGDGQSYD